LPYNTTYYADEICQSADKDYYTTVKYKKSNIYTLFAGINNLRKQLWKRTGVWWQYIYIDPHDVVWEEVE